MVLHPLLDENTPYFVVASVPLGSDTWAAWNYNSTGDVGPFAFRLNGGDWLPANDVRGAFRVEGEAVPEPGPLTLLGLGALGLFGYGRWRRQLAT